MRWLRLIGTAAAGALLVPLAAAPVQAAVPANDKPGGAITLHVGEQVTQDTTQATTDANDAALNESCGAPRTNASVWYKFSTHRDRDLLLDMRASDYSGGFLVFEGAPTKQSLVTCGAGMLGIRTLAGATYTVMVISDTAKRGGNLVMSLHRPPPPPKVKVTVARRGLAYKGGAARLHGTYTCRNARGDRGIFGNIFQRAGRLKIPAKFRSDIRCNGRTHHWTARAVSRTGLYDRGPARVRVGAFACGAFDCTQVRNGPVRVRLVRAHGRDHHRRATHGSPPAHARPLVDGMTHWGVDQSSSGGSGWNKG